MRMTWRLAAVALALGAALLGDDAVPQKIYRTDTQRVEFPAGGVLRIDHSYGELTVEGWDQPQMEITTVKSTPLAHPASQREAASRQLDQVRIAVERHGGEVDVTTSAAHRRLLAGWRGAADIDVDYRIRVPRQTRLIVRHGAGEVHVGDLAGDIDIRLVTGEITLDLPDAAYAIDAKCGIGDIVSDFPGRSYRRPLIFAHGLLEQPASTARKLDLRVRFGDIILRRISPPAYPAP